MDPPDYTLLERIAANDRAAFAAFYHRHAERVHGLLLRLVGNREEAGDVLQETFWQVWRRADRFDRRRASGVVWLTLIARSRALDHLRRRPRERSADEVIPSGHCASPALVAEQRESTRLARRALATLPDEQRTVLSLAFYRGMTHQAIASRLDLALGTVKTRIRLGMKRLKARFEQLQEGEGP
jgi:RNA polymerase sigma-70 factor (ECF subfamily)